MPTVSTKESEENILDEPTAFTVINTDTFGPLSQISIYGSKPNAIVRPLRRGVAIESHQNYYQPEEQHGLKELEEQILSSKPPDVDDNLKGTDFVKELDAKLRKLQADAKRFSKNENFKENQQQQQLQKRPLFITTVPKGIFLQPTKELPYPKPTKRVYAYATRPRILINPNNDKFHSNSNLNNLNNNDNNLNNYNKRSDKEETVTSNSVTGLNTIPSGVAGVRIGRCRDQSQSYQNVMFDRRVVRGSNFQQCHMSSQWNPHFAYAGLLSGKGDGESHPVTNNKEGEARRRQIIRKKYISRNQRGVIGTPPAIRGRKHENVQTEKYLEELVARPPEFDASCQTDLFLHRPLTPPYCPAKVGFDVGTEIAEGDLFDFDTEVEPMLEILIGKTLEQALIEVMHEEEIADLKEQQERLLAVRQTEKVELRRLVNQEDRLQAEKERRIAQDEITKKLDREMQERITAAKLLQGHIADLLPGVLKSMDQVKNAENQEELEKKLAPWLAKEVAKEIGQIIDSRELLEEIVREILQQRAEEYSTMVLAKADTDSETDDADDYDEDEFLDENQEETDEAESLLEAQKNPAI